MSRNCPQKLAGSPIPGSKRAVHANTQQQLVVGGVSDVPHRSLVPCQKLKLRRSSRGLSEQEASRQQQKRQSGYQQSHQADP